MNLYMCRHQTIDTTREKSFHKNLAWLETTLTDPLTLKIINAFWHGENLVLDPQFPKHLESMFNNVREISLYQMWLYFLPIGMVDCQESHYQQIGSRKSAKEWGLDLVQKTLRITYGLLMWRNNILHLRANNVIRELNNINMQKTVSQ